MIFSLHKLYLAWTWILDTILACNLIWILEMCLILDLRSKYPFKFVNRELLQGLYFLGPKPVAAETAFFILGFIMLLECKYFWEIELLNYKSLQARGS